MGAILATVSAKLALAVVAVVARRCCTTCPSALSKCNTSNCLGLRAGCLTSPAACYCYTLLSFLVFRSLAPLPTCYLDELCASIAVSATPVTKTAVLACKA